MARKKPEDAKPDAWMPFYVATTMQEAAHLTTEQFGAYVLLLGALWTRGGRLPAHSQQLRTLARLDPEPWRDAWPLLFALFEDRGDHLTHRRVSTDYEQAVAIYQKKSAAGAAGAAKRWQTDGKPMAPGMADALANGMADPMHSNNHNHKVGSSNELPTTGADGSFEPDTGDDFRGLVDAARMQLQGAGVAAVALRKVGVQVTSQNPDLLAAMTAGVTVEHLLELAGVHAGKPIRYLTSAAMRELAERGTVPVPGKPGERMPEPQRRTDGVSPRKAETPQTRLEAAESYVADMQRYGTMDAEAAETYLQPYREAAHAAPKD